MVRYFLNQGRNQGFDECKWPSLLTQSALFCHFFTDIDINVNTYIFFKVESLTSTPFVKAVFYFGNYGYAPCESLSQYTEFRKLF